MGIWAVVIGVVMITLAIYQIIALRNYFKQVKNNGNSSTSPFVMTSMWNLVIFIGFLLLVGIVCFR
jgi:hypothetical protein